MLINEPDIGALAMRAVNTTALEEVAEEEWLPFQAVNRDRGDALLGILWFPDAPEGW